ncbi:MAG: 3-dehydroquinate synthase [Myxococcota bacterium]
MRAVSKPRPVFLVGMMGAGKSTIGPRLAARLGRPFLDSDREVERAVGRSVAEIFAKDGEARFRALEREAIERAARRAAVVALGGGAIAQPGAARRLRARGRIVHLDAPVECLLERIGDAPDRPLLAGLGPAARKAKLEALIATRRVHYDAAHHRVDASLEPEAVVDQIAAWLETDPVRLEHAAGAGGQRGRAGGGSMGGRQGTGKRGGRGARSRRLVGTGASRARVGVDLGERSYAIELGHDWLETAGRRIADLLGAERVAIVSVAPVARRYATLLARGLTGAGVRVGRIVVPDGDSTKNLRELGRLYERFLDLGLDRHSAVVALGGGVVGDLAGFAAATFLRGIPFVQVPTTVLAMVDASIGGKTGINLPRGKNLVGAFHQPRGVLIDTATLASLPLRQRAAGAAELIKAAAIWDADLFAWLEDHIEDFLALEPEVVLHALERACAIKAEVVARDEREGGLRRLLNFGHTLGHAIEKHARYRGILHGEAVAIGMIFAAERSEALGHAPTGTADRLRALIERAGLPTSVPDKPRQAYLAAVGVDKKRQGSGIHFVVLKAIGRAGTVPLRPDEILPPGWRAKRRS